jgi:hypothetical protein
MNTGSAVATLRTRLRDEVAPYLWSDAELLSALDEAQIRFCTRGFGIADVSTAAVVQVPIVATVEFAALHASILTIRHAELQSTRRPLTMMNSNELPVAQMDYGRAYQLNATYSHTPGPVTAMVIGEQQNLCRWMQIPVVNDTALLSVYRLPLTPVTGLAQEFEIPREHHMTLTYWAEHLAWSKNDAETFNPKAATRAEQRFEQLVVEARLAWQRYMNKPRSVVYGGI